MSITRHKAKGNVYEPRPGISQRYEAFYREVYAPLAVALRPICSALAAHEGQQA